MKGEKENVSEPSDITFSSPKINVGKGKFPIIINRFCFEIIINDKFQKSDIKMYS
jgi:hypothetical protein